MEDRNNLALQTIERYLIEIPFLSQKVIQSQSDNELTIRLCLPSGEITLLVEIKTNGEPRYARDAINRIYRTLERFPNAYGLFVAPYISPQSAKLCEKERVGYLDFVGNCLLTFDQIYIRREGYPNLYAEKRLLRSLYAPKAERILRVLLTHSNRFWKTQELANEAQVSLGPYPGHP